MTRSLSSSTTSGGTLAIDRRPTRQGVMLVAVLAALALAGLFAAARLMVFLPLAITAVAYALWCVHRLRAPRIARLMLHADGHVVMIPVRDGDNIQGELAGTPFVSSWLICLGVRAAGRRRSFCFFPDSTDADTFRRLAARLKNL